MGHSQRVDGPKIDVLSGTHDHISEHKWAIHMVGCGTRGQSPMGPNLSTHLYLSGDSHKNAGWVSNTVINLIILVTKMKQDSSI